MAVSTKLFIDLPVKIQENFVTFFLNFITDQCILLSIFDF